MSRKAPTRRAKDELVIDAVLEDERCKIFAQLQDRGYPDDEMPSLYHGYVDKLGTARRVNTLRSVSVTWHRRTLSCSPVLSGPVFMDCIMHITMSNFYIRGIASNLVVFLLILVCLFLPVGSWNYWQAWVFIAVFELSAQAYGIYFLINDRKLLERRMKLGPMAEKVPAQKIIATLFILGFVAMFVFPAFDHRFGWSQVPPYVSVFGNALVVLSFVFFFFVMKANSYAAATIQVEEGQPVISTGPYAHVRHPMYAGVLILLAGMQLALGTWWGFLLILLFMPVLVWRLIDEEKFLQRNLPGYTAYTQKVRSRLLPLVW